MKTVKQIFHESNYACAIERTHRDSRLFDVVLAVAIAMALAASLVNWWTA